MDEKLLKVAAETMKTTADVAKDNNKYIDEIDGYYFWNPIRGGISVIIDKNGEKLSACSRVKFDDHLKEFKNGRRN